jgi:hypothetical protein
VGESFEYLVHISLFRQLPNYCQEGGLFNRVRKSPME